MTKVIVEKVASLSGHRDSIYSLERSATPSLFYSAAGDGMIVEWDLTAPKDGYLIAQVANSVYSLCYCDDTNSLLVGQNFNGIHEIDIDTKQEIRSVSVTDAAIFDLKVAGDKILIATGDGMVIVVNRSDFSVSARLDYSKERVRSIEVSESNNQMIVGYSDNKIRVFDLESYELITELNEHENSVFSVKLTDDVLLSSGRDAQIKVWDSKNYTLKKNIPAHMYAINDIVLSPDGKYFATCSMDKSIKVWDAESFALLKVIDKSRHAGHGTSVNKLLWSKYNNYIVSGSDDRTIAVWGLKFND